MNYQYPETVILSITTHGEIPIRSNTSSNTKYETFNFETFKFNGSTPQSKIVIITSTLPGVSNIWSGIMSRDINEKILNDYNKFLNERISIQPPVVTKSSIQRIFSFFFKTKTPSPVIQITAEQLKKCKKYEVKSQSISPLEEFSKITNLVFLSDLIEIRTANHANGSLG